MISHCISVAGIAAYLSLNLVLEAFFTFEPGLVCDPIISHSSISVSFIFAWGSSRPPPQNQLSQLHKGPRIHRGGINACKGIARHCTRVSF